MTSYFWAASWVTALELALATCKCIKYNLLSNHFQQKSAVIRWVLRAHFLCDIWELDPALDTKSPELTVIVLIRFSMFPLGLIFKINSKNGKFISVCIYFHTMSDTWVANLVKTIKAIKRFKMTNNITWYQSTKYSNCKQLIVDEVFLYLNPLCWFVFL